MKKHEPIHIDWISVEDEPIDVKAFFGVYKLLLIKMKSHSIYCVKPLDDYALKVINKPEGEGGIYDLNEITHWAALEVCDG